MKIAGKYFCMLLGLCLNLGLCFAEQDKAATTAPAWLAGPERYKARVPDTFDLAERAALSVNALTGAVDPRNRYEAFQCGHLDLNPPYMSHRCAGPCLPKPVQMVPMMRLISGSEQRGDYDRKMMDSLLQDVGEDGLWWIRVGDRPWRLDTYLNYDQFWSGSQGRLMLALLTWHQLDGDPRWLETATRMAKGLMKVTQSNEDRAWIPTVVPVTGFAMDAQQAPDGSDKSGQTKTSSSQTTEPVTVGFESQGVALRGLARYAAVTGDPEALEVCRKLVNFMRKPSCWGPVPEGPSMSDPHEHGRWESHFHSRTMGVMGILEYAIAANDSETKRFVRSFYEYARNFGISRIGFFPAVVGPLKELRERNQSMFGGPGQVAEGCAIGDMIWIAARLSQEGIGDYWEDVDQYVRNQMAEIQVIDRKKITDLLKISPSVKIDPRLQTTDDVIERNIGSFVSGSDPTGLYLWWTMCCDANVPQGMYQAWNGIVQHEEGIAIVNLLLNRASPWVDVDSYLPYEGKVVLKNKIAQRFNVRVPVWADKHKVICKVGKETRPLRWMGQYLMLEEVPAGQEVTITFPMVETIEHYSEPTYGVTYKMHFKGNTLIDISPRPEKPNWIKMGDDAGDMFDVKGQYPIYQREEMRQGSAPMKEITRFASPGGRLP